MGRNKSVADKSEVNDMADALLIKEFGEYLSAISASFAKPFRESLKEQHDELVMATRRELEEAGKTFEHFSGRIEKYTTKANVLIAATKELKTLKVRYSAVEHQAKRLAVVVSVMCFVQLVGFGVLGWLIVRG
jgi:hypothetical protein